MLDIEKFIVSVQKRPALYDMSTKEYSNKHTKARCWAEVGEEMFDDWNDISPSLKNQRGKELMKKWKALRDNFVREYRVLSENGALKKKKYIFYDHLTFLAPHVKSGDKTSNTAASKDTEQDLSEERVLSSLWDDLSCSDPVGEQLQDTSAEAPSLDNCSPSETFKRRARVKKRPLVRQNISSAAKHMIQEIQESVPTQQEECNPDKYGNRAFMLSYLPIMDGLPQQAQLHARMLITQVFYDLQSQPEENESE